VNNPSSRNLALGKSRTPSSSFEQQAAHDEKKRVAFRLAVRERYFKDMDVSGKREPFETLDLICKPTFWTSDDNIAKTLYEKIHVMVDRQDPDELAMLRAVNDAQLEFREMNKDEYNSEEWSLWDLCVVLENRDKQHIQLWRDGIINKMRSLVEDLTSSFYDVEIPPIFCIIMMQKSCDEDSYEEESIETPNPSDRLIFSNLTQDSGASANHFCHCDSFVTGPASVEMALRFVFGSPFHIRCTLERAVNAVCCSLSVFFSVFACYAFCYGQ